MPLMNFSGDNYNKKLEELERHLSDLHALLILDEGMLASSKIPEIERMLKEISQDNILKEILNGIKELNIKFEKQEKLLFNIGASVFKMHQDGIINNEIFAKLNEYLEEYYPEPYQSGNS